MKNNNLFFLTISLLITVSMKAQTVVTLYEHIDYGGKALELEAGEYDLTTDKYKSFNDIISSIKVEPGYSVIVYKDWKFSGDEMSFSKSDKNLMPTFNDRISGVKVISNSLKVHGEDTIIQQNVGESRRVGQSFKAPATGNLQSITVKSGKGPGNGGLLVLDLYEYNNSKIGNLIGSSNSAGYFVNDGLNKRTFQNITLSKDKKYAFVCRNAGWNSHPVAASNNNPYANGTAFICKTKAQDPNNLGEIIPESGSDLWFEVIIE